MVFGPGSDCAAVEPARGLRLVATTDAVVEGVHFDLRRFSPEDVGWKALAVNLSDLAAAGARPRWFLCALGIPRKQRAEVVARRIARGMAALARQSGCALIGGNVTSASEWSVTITALGEAKKPLARSGGGRGGGGGGGRGVREGLLAARFASAAIDVSDGFLQDLRHLADASGVGAVVECSSLPLGRAARSLPDGMELALTGGEDYALILSVPRRKLAALQKVLDCAEVGRILRGSGVTLTELGQPRPVPRRGGFDHLE